VGVQWRRDGKKKKGKRREGRRGSSNLNHFVVGRGRGVKEPRPREIKRGRGGGTVAVGDLTQKKKAKREAARFRLSERG